MDPFDFTNGSYLSVFANSALDGTHEALFGLLIVCLGRLLPIVALAPFLGAKVLPHPVKIALAICLWIMFLPTLANSVTTSFRYDLSLLALGGKEFIIGLFIGFLISIPFTLMQSVGFIIDHQRGASSLNVNDPNLQNMTSPIGLFYNFLLIYIFYQIDGPFYFFELVNQSFKLIPPDQYFTPQFFYDESEFWKIMTKLANDFMVLSIRLASPSMIIILMTDFFLGIANRLAPQVQIIFLGLGLKSTVPILVMALGFYIFCDQAAKETLTWIQKTQDMVVIIKQGTTTPTTPTP